jgi:cystathionine gamma-synthase
VPDTPLNAPIIPASALHPGESGYARDGSPAWTPLEQAVGVLESGEAVCFSSGMAAFNAAVRDVANGSRVVAPRMLYRGVRQTLEHLAASGLISVEWVDTTDTAATVRACQHADVMVLESPANPMIAVSDLPALCGFARERGVYCIVDNTMASPMLQNPLELGATVVLHSLTKWIGGHSDLLLGALITRDEQLHALFREAREVAGATPGVLESYLALRGLRTFPLRFARCQDNALELARRLADHAAVSTVRYPGLPDDPHYERAGAFMRGAGGVLAFELRGGAEEADAVVAGVRLFTHATSFGGVGSSLERRARWPGEQGVPESLIRVSVGIEYVEDLWSDLAQALAAAA